MKKTLLLLSLLFSLTVFAVNAQNKPNEKQILTEEASSLLKQGKFSEAIEKAEKVVKIAEKEKSSDNNSYINAVANLARINQGCYLILTKESKNPNLEPRLRAAAAKKRFECAEAAYQNFNRVLTLNNRAESIQNADVKTDLAMLAYKMGSREKIDESEKLFLDSIALNEKLRGKESEETLYVVLKTGDFYFEMSNYEKALPFYERFVQTTEKKHGVNHPALTEALRPLAKIFYTTFQDEQVAETLKKIETITKKPETSETVSLHFGLRSKDSVAFMGKIIPEYRDDLASFNVLYKVSSVNPAVRPKLTSVPVKVVVDETGKITEAVAETDNKKLKARAEQEISKWTVRPFSYGGTTRKLRGQLTYIERD